jgi:hypothetical protein
VSEASAARQSCCSRLQPVINNSKQIPIALLRARTVTIVSTFNLRLPDIVPTHLGTAVCPLTLQIEGLPRIDWSDDE